MMQIVLLALAFASFCIGTTEFVIMGLLPGMAQDLGVSIPKAGLLVTGYALSVALGAPLMALFVARFPRKQALLGLMLAFVLGNIACALAPGYGALMTARVLMALCHGAFFGVGLVEAASLVPPARRASAVALLFSGVAVSNVLGVPFGTWLGQMHGWRSTFWAVAAMSLTALIGLLRTLPPDHSYLKPNMRAELRVMRTWRIWVALCITVLFSAAFFTSFTYIAPILQQVTHMPPSGISGTLLLFGIGFSLGNLIGGKLADWRLTRALLLVFVGIALGHLAFACFIESATAMKIVMLLLGTITSCAGPGLQINVANAGKGAGNLVAALNIGAFNMGNALGAWLGGAALEHGVGYRQLPYLAIMLITGAFAVTLTAKAVEENTRKAQDRLHLGG